METHEEFQERIRSEQQMAARLRLAAQRLDDAQRERVWAIVKAHPSGLSVRQIATATGLSSSWVHQLLGSEAARKIPRSLSQQRRQGRPSQPDVSARLADEVEALRRCHEWLERLDRGERVVVNLRPETDPETEYVAFDRPREIRHSPSRDGLEKVRLMRHIGTRRRGRPALDWDVCPMVHRVYNRWAGSATAVA
jgi:hypothetical protein